ncbi:MAG: hypothetical protein R3D00_11085 [Bacteroidia bacterium]
MIQILEYVRESPLDEVVEKLNLLLLEDSGCRKEWVLISTRFHDYRRAVLRGTLSEEQTGLEGRRIWASLLEWLATVPEEDWDSSIIDSVLPAKKGKDATGSFENLRMRSRSELENYIDYYKQQTQKNRRDHLAYMGLGYCYLHLGLFDFTVVQFQAAIQLAPDFADAYYYLAIGQSRGRKLVRLNLPVVREMESLLHSAISLDEAESKYHYFMALIKNDYYFHNGMTVPAPGVAEHLRLASDPSMRYDYWELERLIDVLKLENPQWKSILLRQNNQ